MEQNKNFISALKGFQIAYANLVEAWDTAHDINKLYPFEKSFDEYRKSLFIISKLNNLLNYENLPYLLKGF